jgi:phage terminase small subunit
MALTAKQKLFAETYISNGFNALDAYHSAFGNEDNKKPSYPYTLLKKPEVQEYIENRRQEVYDSLRIDAIRVM